MSDNCQLANFSKELARDEVEGIGHNLPFLSAVMDHPRFIMGDITTAFIEEEYPDGFTGVELPEDELLRVAASCAAMNRVAEIRRTKISGRMDNHERRVGDKWIVTLQDKKYELNIIADQLGSTVKFEGGSKIRVEGNWVPGDQLANMLVDDTKLTMKVGKITGGFRIRTRGADMMVIVRSQLQSELARHMIEKDLPDTSRILAIDEHLHRCSSEDGFRLDVSRQVQTNFFISQVPRRDGRVMTHLFG